MIINLFNLHSRIENAKQKIGVMKSVREIIEMHAFGVCSAIGERMGIASTRIRMWFIYLSFMTFGSPLIIYMVLAFWINIKNYIYSAKRNPLRYL
ncbi:MAG: PspC family transcriptional regulator [Segetibacter sp.]|jgi:phage shock protein PspC (stress-responsive transcriptional regulator)|nr:PspC family transcriptional regulator [Segetibacter sp.]